MDTWTWNQPNSIANSVAKLNSIQSPPRSTKNHWGLVGRPMSFVLKNVGLSNPILLVNRYRHMRGSIITCDTQDCCCLGFGVIGRRSLIQNIQQKGVLLTACHGQFTKLCRPATNQLNAGSVKVPWCRSPPTLSPFTEPCRSNGALSLGLVQKSPPTNDNEKFWSPIINHY